MMPNADVNYSDRDISSEVLVSLVNHSQLPFINNLLSDLEKHCKKINLILTNNLPNDALENHHHLECLQQINNLTPQGFSTNNNNAFNYCDKPFFCVINPDIHLLNNPFPDLIRCFQDPKVGLVAPQIISPNGSLEDNARYFPTLSGLTAKLLGLGQGRYLVSGTEPAEVDWTAGMFLLFRADAFRDIGGFDEKFFLYYEDVDICARLWKAGWKVMLQPQVQVIHEAQRTSRKNLRYMRWHLASMVRYFIKYSGRLPR